MRAAKFSCAHPTGRADSERIDTANAIDIGAILTSELAPFEFSAPSAVNSRRLFDQLVTRVESMPLERHVFGGRQGRDLLIAFAHGRRRRGARLLLELG